MLGFNSGRAGDRDTAEETRGEGFEFLWICTLCATTVAFICCGEGRRRGSCTLSRRDSRLTRWSVPCTFRYVAAHGSGLAEGQVRRSAGAGFACMVAVGCHFEVYSCDSSVFFVCV